MIDYQRTYALWFRIKKPKNVDSVRSVKSESIGLTVSGEDREIRATPAFIPRHIHICPKCGHQWLSKKFYLKRCPKCKKKYDVYG